MNQLLKISQLAARAGVSKSTVQHYIREGLLAPPAKKTHKNMAYYRPELVERIRLIKELQEKRNLPLAAIKQLIKDPQAIADIRASLLQEPASRYLDSSQKIAKARLIEETRLSEYELNELEKRGFISIKNGFVSANDAAIVHAVTSMRQAGLNEAAGFSVDDMAIYMQAMRNLALQEVTLFAKRMSSHNAAAVIAAARAGVEGTNLLLMALRRKIFLDLLEGKSDLFWPASGRKTKASRKRL